MSFDINSVGYHKTGGRYDFFCSAGFACIVDTTNKGVSDWGTAKSIKLEVGYLNSNSCFDI